MRLFSFSCLLLLVACSGAASTSSSISPTTNEPDAGTGGGDDAGSKPNVDGSAPDGGTPDPFGGADICGNGIDDDGNGVVDDGCGAPTCTPSLNGAFDLAGQVAVVSGNGNGDAFTFDHAHKQIVTVAGRSDGFVHAFSEADGSAIATSTNVARDTGILTAFGGYLPYLADTGNALFDPTLLHPTAITATGLQGATEYGFATQLYGIYRDTQTTGKYRVYDSALNTSAPIAAPFDLDVYSTLLIDGGGLPVWVVVSASSDEDGEDGESYSVQLAALGPTGLRWKSAITTDVWNGTFRIQWAGAARSQDRFMFCTGGSQVPVNSGAPPANIHFDCHMLDAKTGAHILDVAIDHPPTEPNSMRVVAGPDGFLLVRTIDEETGATPIHIDRMTLDGTVTKNVLTANDVPNLSLIDVRQLDPTSFAMLFENDTSDNARVAVIGCK